MLLSVNKKTCLGMNRKLPNSERPNVIRRVEVLPDFDHQPLRSRSVGTHQGRQQILALSYYFFTICLSIIIIS